MTLDNYSYKLKYKTKKLIVNHINAVKIDEEKAKTVPRRVLFRVFQKLKKAKFSLKM